MKKNWKLFFVAFAALAGIFLLLIAAVKSDKDFRVTKFDEVKSEYGPDGRAPVGSPEVYQIRPSAAYTWEMTKHNTGLWRTLAWVFIVAGAVYIFAYGTDLLSFEVGSRAPGAIFAVILAAAAACIFAAYSSAYDNNYVEVSKEKYEAIKDDPAALQSLFDGKDYIR